MKKIMPWVRSLLVFALIAVIVFGNAHEALARRGGGRIGGGSFRAPTRSVPVSPSRGGGGYYGGGYSSGGGFFFLPFFFGGGGFGGSIFTFLILAAVAGAVLQAFRGAGSSDSEGITGLDSKVTVAKIQVGLLASARELQNDLTRLAMDSDTSSSEGLSLILKETVLSLVRHPEYWVYVSSAKETTKFALAEQKFNGLVMSERSKLNAEVLSNKNGRILQSSKAAGTLPSSGDLSLEDPSEYIVITLMAAVAGDTLGKLPEIRSSEQLKQTLSALGSVTQDQLLAIEVLWEPQSTDYTLTSDEVLTVYPDLVRI
ncbi:DUF1517 domain-containing protein [Tumidithrix elongata RA019]|uniref:DUF1517 domain-containing protein n=1 Tax=Tumidithrix elongata BACA0141 TaxID=2716417 RepID=A0AAW9Q4X0_9CYAN|nr:DUF1517 domain-containing protein [Tumidithrix elongata RA019]